VEHFQRVAPRGRKRVHLMTVLMEDNRDELEELLRLSRSLGVRHMVTLLAVGGYNRASGKTVPRADTSITPWLLDLKARYPHFVDLTEYLSGVDDFLAGRYDTPCQAGTRGFNVNHLGRVNPCIELTNVSMGHILDVPEQELVRRLRTSPEVRGCQQCFTVCRGNVQAVGARRWRSLVELLS
jgi:MoaA/NifB/PqqE/SkfB family radical SAM enzyme